ncbi:MAG: hypothetical protein IT262_12965 [Saprospiraceae bacterium]|nr:hypothetical protein [Saprospiraceae bacterium]
MPQNFAQYFRTLLILFSALLFGQVAVVAIFYFIIKPPVNEQVLPYDTVVQVLPVVLLLLAGLAFFFNRKKLEAARAQSDIKGKLADYRAASILKWGPVESGTLISAVLFFLTGKILFVYYAVAMIALFATQFPSRQRLISELDLSVNDQMILDDPNAEVAETARR